MKTTSSSFPFCPVTPDWHAGKKHTLTFITVLLLATLATLRATESAKFPAKPNILFAIADDWSYPIRGIVKDGMLYLHNFETNRWPGGLAETGYKETDDSPTKTVVLEAERIPALKHFFDASFGKLPADQLFDLRRDPGCMTNLAGTVSFVDLQQQLFDELKQQEDPRMLGNGHIYDEYLYGDTSVRNYYNRVMRGEKAAVEVTKE